MVLPDYTHETRLREKPKDCLRRSIGGLKFSFRNRLTCGKSSFDTTRKGTQVKLVIIIKEIKHDVNFFRERQKFHFCRLLFGVCSRAE